MKYHVRTSTGVSIDMLELRHVALALAEKEGLEVYELVGQRSTRIYPATTNY